MEGNHKLKHKILKIMDANKMSEIFSRKYSEKMFGLEKLKEKLMVRSFLDQKFIQTPNHLQHLSVWFTFYRIQNYKENCINKTNSYKIMWNEINCIFHYIFEKFSQTYFYLALSNKFSLLFKKLSLFVQI